MIAFLYNNSTLWIIRVVGVFLLVAYLVIYQDFTFSLTWALLQVAIVLGIATGIASLGIPRFIPSLNRYYVPRKMRASGTAASGTDEATYQKREAYMKSLFDKKTVAFLAAEDGLVGVPVLLAGITPWSAVIAGIVFGGLQLPRYTYLECLIKGATYILICMLVLPNGILTVVAGHYLTDGLIWLGFKHRKL